MTRRKREEPKAGLPAVSSGDPGPLELLSTPADIMLFLRFFIYSISAIGNQDQL
jgi:hypothetical protein